jgi:hypothetical protein
MSHPYPRAEKDKIVTLVDTLTRLVDRDPDQEVQGIALPVLDEVIEAARRVCPDDQVVQATRSVISPEQIESGEAVRAADALLVGWGCKLVRVDAPWGMEQRRQKMPDPAVPDQEGD